MKEGWTLRLLQEVADQRLGKMLDKAKNLGTAKPYLRNLNVRWFDFDLSNILKMRFEDEERERYTAVKGDVLICEGGYPGRAKGCVMASGPQPGGPHDETRRRLHDSPYRLIDS